MSSHGSLDLFDVFIGVLVTAVIGAIIGAVWHYNVQESDNRNRVAEAQIEACDVPEADPLDIANCVLLLDD